MTRLAIALLALAFLAPPLAAEAQPGKVHRIGVLVTGRCARYANPDHPFRRALHELGYIGGQNITIECRSPVLEEGTARVDYDRLPDLAVELVRLNVDILVTLWNTRAAFSAKNATSTIPIVMVGIPTDPVRQGLVAGLAKPGGNLTGIFDLSGELDPKRLELLREAAPEVSRVGILFDEAMFRLASLEEPARMLGLHLTALGVRRVQDLEGAFQLATRERVGALLVANNRLLFEHRGRVAELALRNRLPAIAMDRDYAEAGLLMTYAADTRDIARRGAVYVDKILKGAKPGDLPVEQPSRYALVVNLKTAKALTLMIPPSVLVRADEVIQ